MFCCETPRSFLVLCIGNSACASSIAAIQPYSDIRYETDTRLLVSNAWYVVVIFHQVVVVVVVLTLTRIIKSVVTGQTPVTLELRNTPGKNTNSPRWYTRISQLTQFMPPPDTYKSEIGSRSTMCPVHTGAYVSLLTPGETDYTACHPRKTTTHVYITLRISYHTHRS